MSWLLRIHVPVYQSDTTSVSVPTRAFVPRSTQYLRIFPWIFYGNGSFRTFCSRMLPGPTMFQDTLLLSKESRKTNLESCEIFIFPVWPESDACESFPRLYYPTFLYDLWIKSFRLLALPISVCLCKTLLITSLSFCSHSFGLINHLTGNFHHQLSLSDCSCLQPTILSITLKAFAFYLRLPLLERRFKHLVLSFLRFSLRFITRISWRSLRSFQVLHAFFAFKFDSPPLTSFYHVCSDSSCKHECSSW